METATITGTDKTIMAVREHFAAARAMHRSERLGKYQGRNGGGDSSWHMAEAEHLADTLRRQLRGALWAEHRLAERISENRDADNERPELRARMTRYRREIRTAYRELEVIA